MITLTKHQKEHLDLIILGSDYGHATTNRVQVFFRLDGAKVNDAALQAHLDNFDLLTPARVAAKKRVNTQSQAIVEELEASYPAFEKRTWSMQQPEAEAWEKDNTALTPMLSGIAFSRGVDRVVLIEKALMKIKEDTQTAAYLVGKRQGLEDLIDASNDLNVINAINFEL